MNTFYTVLKRPKDEYSPPASTQASTMSTYMKQCDATVQRNLRCVQTESKANFKGGAIAYKVIVKMQVDVILLWAAQNDAKRICRKI